MTDYSFLKHKIIGGIGADDLYWAGLEDGEFRIQRCAKCAAWTWPANHRCGKCGSWEFVWETLEPVGTVYSWTRSYYAFDRVLERREDVPYVTVLAEIPAAGNARVMGVLEGDETALKCGAPVRGVIAPPEEKTKWYPSIRWSLA